MSKIEKVVVSGVPSDLVDAYTQTEAEIKRLQTEKAQLRKVLLAYIPQVFNDRPVNLLLLGKTNQVLLSKPVVEMVFTLPENEVKDFLWDNLSEQDLKKAATFTFGELRSVLTPEGLSYLAKPMQGARKFTIQPLGH